MGVKDGFMGANTLTKIVFFIILVAVVVNWIAFCTTSWYLKKITARTITYRGLWRECQGTTCTPIDGITDADIDAGQAFAIFGFMSLNVGFLLIILYMFWGSCKGNREAGLAAAITLICSAGFWVISVAILGAKLDNDQGSFGYSYALAVCALILALIGGFIMLIGRRSSSVSSTIIMPTDIKQNGEDQH